MYDINNVFARIIKGEIPATIIYENEYAMAFKDINPKAKHHVLLIPKKPFTHLTDFMKNSNSTEISDFFSTIPIITKQLGIKNYKILSNNGEKAGQEVPHFHIHIISNDD